MPPPPQQAAYPPDIPKRPFHRLRGPQTLNPGKWPLHFPYADAYDAAAAAPEVHQIRYVDSHVRFVEVAYFPGVHGKMHGHPYPSVFANDAPGPHSFNISLDEENTPLAAPGHAPKGRQWPTCLIMGPQAPHAETNLDSWPHHFYRLDFKRLDGTDFQAHWRDWYPQMASRSQFKDVTPAKGSQSYSGEWPFPIDYDAPLAAPNNHRLLFEDGHVRLVEVTIRPGETENVHGHPYSSVFAYDQVIPASAAPAKGGMVNDHKLDPASLLNGQDQSVPATLAEFQGLSCSTMGPQAPHAVTNRGTVPIHFYRIEFKRIDGDDLKAHWREWYPWMAAMAEKYAANPYDLNY
jgi:hypothetical protein